MRMTKDPEVWLLTIQKGSSVLRELPAFLQNMTDGQFHHGLWWRPTLLEPIDVAGGHCDRGSALSLTFRMPNPWSSLNRRWSVQVRLTREGLSSPSQPYSIRERMEKPIRGPQLAL